MSIVNVVFLSAAICGFAIFAIVLACVDYRTGKMIKQQIAEQSAGPVKDFKKAA